jgi:hypothetical protein
LLRLGKAPPGSSFFVEQGLPGHLTAPMLQQFFAYAFLFEVVKLKSFIVLLQPVHGFFYCVAIGYAVKRKHIKTGLLFKKCWQAAAAI